MTTIEFINCTVGKPYRARHDGPDYYDCGGLLRASFRAIDGIELHEFFGYCDLDLTDADCIQHEVFVRGKNEWVKSQPANGAMMVAYDKDGHPIHVGRCLNGGILHAYGKNDCGQVQWHNYKTIKRMPYSRLEFFKYAGHSHTPIIQYPDQKIIF